MQEKKHIQCLIVDDEATARDIIALHISKIESLIVVASSKNAMEALDVIRSNKIDLIFLDINMPNISGISFAKSINKNIKIIFTTAYRDYAVEGFELKAVDYLLKPISFDRLLNAVNTYFNIYKNVIDNNLSHPDVNSFMFVRSNRQMIKIDFESITYVESCSDYVKVHLENEVLVTRETISTIEAKLPQINFIRIHRSFIIAVSKITSFTNEYILIHNQSLTIGRSYKKEVLNYLESY